MTHRTPNSGNARAFTIVEMLIVIGILIVVTVGVATIFGSVGETVAKGRKLSELNQFAARIERVMRQDFEQLTRDGFLVIINKNANYGEDIQLYRGEQFDPDGNGDLGRPRRSDEIMFFARGVFESQRRAIDPSLRASSNEAAIYYGHGQKRAPQLTNVDGNNNYFFNPQPWDNNYTYSNSLDTRLGAENIGFVNPNEFARDWSLLRHVTLLTNPQGAGQQLPAELYGFSSSDPLQRPLLQDSARQISLQPASRSIFKSLSGSLRRDPVTNELINRSLYDIVIQGQAQSSDYFPLNLRTSGTVDIVTQDLATIRNELQSLAVDRDPDDYMNFTRVYRQLASSGLSSGFTTRDLFEDVFYQTPGTNPSPSRAGSLNLGRRVSSTWSGGNAIHRNNIRKWMIDALPSAWDVSSTLVGGSTLSHDQFIGGVRYEDIPTRLLFGDDDFDNSDRGAIERAYAEANQEMLGSSVFIPRCTEFVVEWSYGYVNNGAADGDLDFKQLIWYGLERAVEDTNDDGFVNAADRSTTQLYSQRTTGQAGNEPVTNNPRFLGAPTSLITGRTGPITSTTATIEASCFGFGTQPSNPEGAVWPWPKLIRITMTLGDPNDRDIEQTYQVIFEIPDPE